jgi:hypothetical protein
VSRFIDRGVRKAFQRVTLEVQKDNAGAADAPAAPAEVDIRALLSNRFAPPRTP